METTRADISQFAGLCVLIFLAVSIAGCTSQNAATTTPSATTTQQDLKSAATTSTPPLLTPAPSLADSPVKTETQTVVKTAQTQEKVSLIVNSVQKQDKLNTIIPSAGRMFLVVNITINNNAIEKGFYLTDDRITLNYVKGGTATEKSQTTRVRGGLQNPLLTPIIIELNDKKSGQVVFGVVDISNAYTIHLIDDSGAVLSSSPIAV